MARLLDHPVLARGFRPFFILGSAYSVLCMLQWVGVYSGFVIPQDFFFLDPVSWHAHEMIYGYTMAIVAGFLLTAVANWTAGAPVRQYHLLGLCILWVIGRITLNFDLNLPFWALVITEGAFIPALTASLSVPLLRSWSKRNFIFLTLLSVLFVCDMWFMFTHDKSPLFIAIMVIVMMISLIGGRIIPSFTVAALHRKGIKALQTPQAGMDIAALASLVLVTVCLVSLPESGFMAFCALASAIVHLMRMRYYHTLKTFQDPMLWILQAGYLWVVAGLLLLALSGVAVLDLPTAIHALTAGAIGTMTLGMMCRVSLGHTGRDLQASRPTVVAFALIIASGLTRIIGPLIVPGLNVELMAFSAILWAFGFLIFIMVYAPVLWHLRPDGRTA
ncbi:MAG: NnrS family protein [Rhodospirillales bacterium]|nr:NnrS family protein [Rhodospirillales bacterium]